MCAPKTPHAAAGKQSRNNPRTYSSALNINGETQVGMFDYIRCELPLPESDKMPPEGMFFQTKDTPDQYMTVYTIKADGQLYCERQVEEDETTIPFHGDIFFYSYSNHDSWEYRARFTEGICTKIVLVNFDPGIPTSPPL